MKSSLITVALLVASASPATAQDWVLSGWTRGAFSAVGALDLAVAWQLVAELWRGMRENDGK